MPTNETPVHVERARTGRAAASSTGRLPVAVIGADLPLRRRIEQTLRGVTDAESGDAHVVVVAVAAGDDTALARARRRHPGASVVVVAAAGAAAPEAADVEGLVPEALLETALEPAVRCVAAGLRVLPENAVPAHRRPALSRRERQVLGLVVMGLANREIAATLHLAEATVKSHLRSSFRKLAVRSRNEAVAAILDPRGGLGLGVLAISDADGAG